jgi:hypothetical protein
MIMLITKLQHPASKLAAPVSFARFDSRLGGPVENRAGGQLPEKQTDAPF